MSMNDQSSISYGRVLMIFAAITVFTGVVISLLTVAFWEFPVSAGNQPGGSVSWVSPQRIGFQARIDGNMYSPGDFVTIVQGQEITPLLNTKQLPNNATVNLTCNGRKIQPGVPFSLHQIGGHRLTASVSTPQMRRPIQQAPIMIQVKRYPQREMITVASGSETKNVGGKVEWVEAEILVASNEFDIRHVYFSHFSLWLEFDDRLKSERIKIAGMPAKRSRDEAQPDSAEAFYFPDKQTAGGYWKLRFVGDFSDEPLNEMPVAFRLTGTGWNEDGYVDLVSDAISIPPAKVDNPVPVLKEKVAEAGGTLVLESSDQNE